ncbi:MAG: hypothetical protein KAR83_01090 [Thermodesulfovibrionales bacterium]|nr:hypothetical protein [Thermodesulfovibrionales bacterium]
MIRKLLLAAAAVLVISCVGDGVRYSPYELQAFPQSVQEQIKNGEVALGMSQQAVRFSWGAPKLIVIKDEIKDAYTEEWVYTRWRVNVTKLVFSDGKLSGIISGVKRRRPLTSLGLRKAPKQQPADAGQQQQNAQ